MKQYKPVGLSDMEDLPKVMVENLNAISSVINNILTSSQTTNLALRGVANDGSLATASNTLAIATNATDISNNTAAILSNGSDIGDNTSSINTNAERSSLNVLYAYTTGGAPGTGLVHYNAGTKSFQINKTSTTGMTIPNLSADNPLRVELTVGIAFAASTAITSVVDSGSYYTIVFTTDATFSTLTSAHAANVGLHWQ